MDVKWYGCDVVSGRIIEELPLRPSGQISHRVGAYTSARIILDIPPAHTSWPQATTPGRTMVALVLDEVVVWGGMVVEREGGTEAQVSLGVVELEGYLDRRYVTEHTWTAQDESVIVSGLVTDAQAEGIGYTLDIPTFGTLRDRTYLATDDKKVYSALRELMGVENGPEWSVLLDWSDATHTAIAKTFRARKRIGAAVDGVILTSPAAIFQAGGESSATYAFAESYAEGYGANHIVATSSGEGDDRPESSPARDDAAIAGGFPRFELHYQPSTSITNTDTLDGHAAEKLAVQAGGLAAFSITARFDAYPRLGVDWVAGDDVGFELIGHRHPAGAIGMGRALGWTLDLARGLISPSLVIPGEGS